MSFLLYEKKPGKSIFWLRLIIKWTKNKLKSMKHENALKSSFIK